MNALQQFMRTCFGQAQPHVQEAAVIGGQTVYGTFGDPQLLPVMTRTGSQDHVVTTFQVDRSWFGKDPAARVSLTRVSTGRVYFVQAIDPTSPGLFTFLLTDRDVGL